VLTHYERTFVPEAKANIVVNINHDS